MRLFVQGEVTERLYVTSFEVDDSYWLVLLYFTTKVEHGLTWRLGIVDTEVSYLPVFV
ncbi:MAG: hypothetical protein OXF54_23000 [Caldilineaceae bacterium]|nr:hypothetical protein [Caldilineaceae bacterium]